MNCKGGASDFTAMTQFSKERRGNGRDHGGLGAPAWPASPLRQASLWASANAVRLVDYGASLVERMGWADAGATRERLIRSLDAGGWPSRRLCVGLASPGSWGVMLSEAAGVHDVEWLSVPAGTSDEELFASRAFDAIVRRDAAGNFCVRLAEHAEREGAWYDWGSERPLSYPGVFPVRLDCSRVTVQAPVVTGSQFALLRAVLECAAVLSRVGARLELTDRLCGRMPVDGFEKPSGIHEFRPDEDPVYFTLAALARALEATPGDGPVLPVQRVASRVLMAWAATCDDRMTDELRASFATASAGPTADEPETMLRLGAVHLSCTQDGAGFEMLDKAAKMLREHHVTTHPDHLSFLQMELENGRPDTQTSGRIAAGICLLASGMSPGELGAFRDDMLDDMRFATALVGRDQDRVMLMQVFRMLEGTKSRAGTKRAGSETKAGATRRAAGKKSRKAA